MKKNKRFITIFIIILSMVVFETIMYELARFISYEPFVLTSKLDEAIPFIAEFIYPYISWYLMIIIVPFLIYIKNKVNFYKYISSLFITIIISTIIFVLFPTTVVRPSIEVNGLTTWLVNTIYLLDTPSLCCLPSMHCTLCFLMIIYTLTTKEFKVIEKIIITLFSIAVIASTILIKQHVIIDAILALIITILVVFIVNKFKLYFKLQKNVENILNKNSVPS